MFRRKQSKEYYDTLEYFRDFCKYYNKHEIYYKDRTEQTTRELPKGNYEVSYNKDTTSFIFIGDNKVKQYVSDELFGIFDLFYDVDFYSIKNALNGLYKPAFLECYNNNGSTHHAIEMNNIVTPLLNKIHDYKENFKYITKRI